MSLRATIGSDNGEHSKKAFLDGQDSYMQWGTFTVTVFHKKRIMHLISKELMFHPHTIDEAIVLEHMHWKHKIDDSVTSTLKSNGVKQTPLYLPINYSAPATAADGKIYAEDGVTELTATKISKLKQT